MFKSGDCVRCLDSSGYPLTSGVNYLVNVGQVDGGAMISLVGFEGAFLASRFEVVSSSESQASDIATRRQSAIDASTNECLTRAGGAVMSVIARGHALLIALRNRGLDNSVMAERAEHLPERMHGSRLCIESIIDELGLDAVVEKHCGEFDQEQLRFDVKNKVTKTLRELV